jgi:transcriptional regulator with XRE-family HTH domain
MGERKGSAEAFGAVLRELRLQKHLTQDELAEKARTERSHISALERAEKAPSLNTVFTIAAALDVSPGHLVDLVHRRVSTKTR